MDEVNLRQREDLIEQYVNLRNSYTDVLLTLPVDVDRTKEWLKKADVEVMGLAKDNILMGVVILYLHRDGEVAFFARERNKGTGSRLLDIIERVAKEKGLRFLWGWVLEDNLIARRTFEKNGYIRKETAGREYKGILKKGVRFTKNLMKEI